MTSSFEALLEDSDAFSAENEAAVETAFGEEGDCWKNGPLDPYYTACESACRQTLQEDCGEDALCTAAIAQESLTCEDFNDS